MKRTILTLFAVAATLAAAGQTAPSGAAAVADSFWHHTLGRPADTPLTDRSAEWDFDGIGLFTAKDGGFVMVGVDSVTKPILGYSATGTVDPAHLPVQLEEWLAVYEQEIAAARKSGIRRKAGTKAVGSSVAPLLTTKWDQYQPYNGMCPAGTVTGCAATAQAQLMKYWNYPPFGRGEHSYVHSQYGTLGADFAHTIYDWDYMPDSADVFNDSERELAAVATLMYHVGVSLDMRYASPQQGGSAAAGLAGIPGYASMDNSLKDYFYYSPDMRVVSKGAGFTDESWRDTLMAELDRGHPILYTGSSPAGGHGFVCDGYDSLGLMHFNFGWSGEGDGYYAIGAITPGIGPDGSLGEYDFSSTNQALLGAVPVRAMRLSDTVKAFVREGGIDSLLFAIDPTLADSAWSVDCDAAWLSVEHDGFARVGWIRIAAGENGTGGQRVATVTFRQGGESVTLRVLQDHYGADDYCPMTVVMESRRGNGWLGGARLTLESEGGFVFGTAQLAGGHIDSVVIPVAPLPLHVVWHGGGGTDRLAGYTVRGPSGDVLLSIDNAYLGDDRHVVAYPCSPLGVGRRPETGSRWSVACDPAADRVDVDCDEPLLRLTVVDAAGRIVLDVAAGGTGHRCSFSTAAWPRGVYLLRALTHAGVRTARLLVKS